MNRREFFSGLSAAIGTYALPVGISTVALTTPQFTVAHHVRPDLLGVTQILVSCRIGDQDYVYSELMDEPWSPALERVVLQAARQAFARRMKQLKVVA